MDKKPDKKYKTCQAILKNPRFSTCKSCHEKVKESKVEEVGETKLEQKADNSIKKSSVDVRDSHDYTYMFIVNIVDVTRQMTMVNAENEMITSGQEAIVIDSRSVVTNATTVEQTL